jgi:hypothetical protein
MPPGRKVQAIKAAGDELKAPKANGFTEGEAIAQEALTVYSDGDHK